MISTPPKMVIQHNMARIFFFFYHAFTSIQLANHRDFFNTHSRFHSKRRRDFERKRLITSTDIPE